MAAVQGKREWLQNPGCAGIYSTGEMRISTSIAAHPGDGILKAVYKKAPKCGRFQALRD